jgi:RNA recognition motif-containing protein
MQENKLYCGNLKYSVTNEQLQELCSSYGEVTSVNIIEGKGFGFVEFASDEDAAKAKEALNGQEYEGRVMRVDLARPRQNRDDRRGGGGGGRRF